MDVRETISRLSQVDKSSFGDDEPSRMQALAEARALVSRLERPWEKVGQMVWTEPTLMLSIKTASDMSLFASMSSNGQTSEQLGQATGADPVLVSRLLRVLVSGAIIEEVDVDTYVETDFSKSLVDRQGIVNGIHYYYDLVAKQTEKLPEYLHKTGYKGPSDAANPPFKYIMESSAGFWEWCITHPEAHANFNSFLSSIRVGQPPWPSYYPPSRLLDGFDGSAALCVDVGGGKGRDLKHLVDAIGNEHPEAALVLQDQASVLEEAKSEDIPSQIQLMPHNFFEPQPCKGARAYFMHSILHDWPDAEGARKTQLPIRKPHLY